MRQRLLTVAPVVIAYLALVSAGLLLRGHVVPIVVSGASMRPALIPGDVVLVAPRRSPHAGDIALVHSGQSLVLHRVTRVLRDGSVLTRGDANPVGDFTPTRRENVRGCVVRVLPAGVLLDRWRRRTACDTLPAQTHTARR